MFFAVFPQVELRSEDYRTETGRLRRGFARVHNTLMRDTADFWHERIFPGHFTPGNEDRYEMKPRTPAYLTSKRRRGTGQGRYVANVFSGMSFRWMMTSFGITATQDSATVRMKAPTYFTQPYNPRGTQPDKPREVTQVSTRDLAEIQKYMQRRYDELTDQFINRGVAAKAA